MSQLVMWLAVPFTVWDGIGHIANTSTPTLALTQFPTRLVPWARSPG